MDTNTLALNYVTERAVAPEIAFNAGFYTVDNAQQLNDTFHPRAALVLPYYSESGEPLNFERVRYFDPPIVGGVKKKGLRYQQPKGTPPELYLPKIQGLDWVKVMQDTSIPVAITEGEVKSLSASINSGIPFIGLGGVFMWADNKLPIKTLERFKFARRKVYIVFDSDIDTNPQVQMAEARLASYLTKNRAQVIRTRLPTGSDGGKQGADDYIAAHGTEAFKMALTEAQPLSDMELRILELNDKVAYLEEEEKIFPIDGGTPINKSGFVDGSIYSTLKGAAVSNGKMVMKSVAREWLSHPLARRYRNTIFRPGADEVVKTSEGAYLNSWQEQPCEPGDVTYFVELTRYLFEDTLADDWMWPIKLLAFKAQNQTKKIPLAMMLIGEQGSGKSLWAKMVTEAFGQYGKVKSGRDLDQNWNGFIENALVATVDDVSARQMRGNIETLRNWISESRVERIEKYLKNREVDNYCLFIFTTNYRDAGAFAHDDRRFLVVGAPRRSFGADHYNPMWDWVRSKEAGPAIYHYLLNYDLEGWQPPIKAPDTAEKKMAHEEALSDFAKLARDMRNADHSVIVRWLQMAEQWAMNVIGSPGHADTPKANEIITAIQHFPIRPWYTAEELCNMFPHMLNELHYRTRRWSNATLPGKVSQALRNEGIYFLRNEDDPTGFMWQGQRQQFLIVCPNAGYEKSMTQAEFDQHMSQMQNYQPVLRQSA